MLPHLRQESVEDYEPKPGAVPQLYAYDASVLCDSRSLHDDYVQHFIGLIFRVVALQR